VLEAAVLKFFLLPQRLDNRQSSRFAVFLHESIHLFLGLPLLLHPFTRTCMAMYGKRFCFILAMWQNNWVTLTQLSRRCLFLSLNYFGWPRFWHDLAMRLRQLISNTLNILFSSSVSVHVSPINEHYTKSSVSDVVRIYLEEKRLIANHDFDESRDRENWLQGRTSAMIRR